MKIRKDEDFAYLYFETSPRVFIVGEIHNRWRNSLQPEGLQPRMKGRMRVPYSEENVQLQNAVRLHLDDNESIDDLLNKYEKYEGSGRQVIINLSKVISYNLHGI